MSKTTSNTNESPDDESGVGAETLREIFAEIALIKMRVRELEDKLGMNQ